MYLHKKRFKWTRVRPMAHVFVLALSAALAVALPTLQRYQNPRLTKIFPPFALRGHPLMGGWSEERSKGDGATSTRVNGIFRGLRQLFDEDAIVPGWFDELVFPTMLAYYTYRLGTKSTHADEVKRALKRLRKGTKSECKKRIYGRKACQETVRKYLNEKEPNYYVVVSSPKGIGKSTIINHVLCSEERVVGVFHAVVDGTENSIDDSIAQSLGASLERIETRSSEFNREVLQLFQETHNILPVLILDIRSFQGLTREERQEKVFQVGQVMKYYTSDTNSALCIADMSSITASEFQQDPRVRFVYVPELNEKETHLFLNHEFQKELDSIDVPVENVFQSVGGNCALLQNLIRPYTDGASLEERIDVVLRAAKMQVEGYLDEYPAHRQALAALVDAGYEDTNEGSMDTGLYLNIIRRDLKEGQFVDADTLQSASSKHAVFYLDRQSNTVVFHTRSHYQMAKAIVKHQLPI
ncbi:hypothetical protein AAMO2058_000084200 [Amorphochlora amoebiformis]